MPVEDRGEPISKHFLGRRLELEVEVEEEEEGEVEITITNTQLQLQPGPTPDTAVSLMHSGMEITGTI